MNTVYEKLKTCKESIRRKTDFVPQIAVVLGSGLGGYGEAIDMHSIVSYSDIEGFPVSTVPGHKGRFIFGWVKGIPVVAMQGRVHYYEGYAMSDVVLPIRLMRLLGAETLLLTNAAGGVNFDFAPGDLMVIQDHISTMIPSPLIGENIDSLGARFPDMSSVYDSALQAQLFQCGQRLHIPLKKGVYMQLSGPQYETPAEIRMARALGADAVGMSTVCEAIAANHMGMRLCGVSCITNLGCGMSDKPLNHKEVQETADKIAESFRQLVTAFIAAAGKKGEEK